MGQSGDSLRTALGRPRDALTTPFGHPRDTVETPYGHLRDNLVTTTDPTASYIITAVKSVIASVPSQTEILRLLHLFLKIKWRSSLAKYKVCHYILTVILH